MAPAAFVGPVGAIGAPGAGAAVAEGDDGVDRGVGKDGSPAPGPGEATGRPPAPNRRTGLRAAANHRPGSAAHYPTTAPAAPQTIRIAHSGYSCTIGGRCTRAPIDAAPMVKFYRRVTDSRWRPRVAIATSVVGAAADVGPPGNNTRPWAVNMIDKLSEPDSRLA